MTNKEEINKDNFHIKFKEYIDGCEDVTQLKLAMAIGCTISTLERLFNKKTLPTNNMLHQCRAIILYGFKKYSKLSKKQKSRLLERIGAAGGGTTGIAIAAVPLASMSGAGIMSTLATVGSVVGGGAAVGVGILATIPILVAGVGYGVVKGYKYGYNTYRIKKDTTIDSYWEEIL